MSGVPYALSPALNQVCRRRLLLFASVLVVSGGYRGQLGASVDPLLVLTAFFEILSCLWGQRLLPLCPVILGYRNKSMGRLELNQWINIAKIDMPLVQSGAQTLLPSLSEIVCVQNVCNLLLLNALEESLILLRTQRVQSRLRGLHAAQSRLWILLVSKASTLNLKTAVRQLPVSAAQALLLKPQLAGPSTQRHFLSPFLIHRASISFFELLRLRRLYDQMVRLGPARLAYVGLRRRLPLYLPLSSSFLILGEIECHHLAVPIVLQSDNDRLILHG